MIAAAWILATAPAVDDPRFHVIDARDKTSIAGATLELWTEDGTKPVGATSRLAVLRSDADGTGTFAYAIGGIRPDQVRVSGDGYASRTVSLSDLEDGVELYPRSLLAGRVLDLAGRPVARAVVRTREVCAHAVPAAETWTDVDGRFALIDCPADAQMAELEVLPQEHVPLAALEIATLRRLQARDGSFDLYVARKPPLRVTVLDERGEPLAGARVAYGAEPYCSGWTDERGVVTLSPQPQWDAALSVLGGNAPSSFRSACVPASGTFRTRLLDDAGPKHAGRLTIDFGPSVGSAARPQVLVIDSAGRNLEGVAFDALANGPATIVVGRDFSPWIEQVHTVEVSPVAQSLVPLPKPAPAVDITLPEDAWWSTVMVQAGDTGFRIDLEGSHESRLHVPPGVDLEFVAVAGDGEVRRARHAPIAEGVAAVDLRDPRTLLHAGVPE